MPHHYCRAGFPVERALIFGASLASVIASPALAQLPATVRLPGVIRDFKKADANFAVTPVGGNGHYAGNIGPLLSLDGEPMFVATGYKVISQWRNSGGQPIPPQFYTPGGNGGGVVIVVSAPTLVGNPTVDSFNSVAGPYGGNNIGSAPTWVAGSVMPTVSEPSGLPQLINSVSYSGGGTSTLSADVHCNTFTIKNNYTLQISGDRTVLVEQTFTMKDHATITLLPNATLSVFIKDDFSTDHDVDVNLNTHAPARVTIINLGTQELSLGEDTHMYATIVSPSAALHLKDNADFCGNFTGQSATLESATGFHNDAGSTPPPTMCGVVVNDTAGTAGFASTGGIISASTFADWYKDAPGTNLSALHTIELVKSSSSVYEYLDDAFHPIDGQLFGDEDQAHNNYFTYTISAPFVHHACAGTFFEFYGADDAWLFVDGKLAMDLGGVLPGTSQYVEIDRIAGLQDGQSYTLQFFYAQRQASQAVFHMRTNMQLIGTTLEATISGSGD